MPGGEEKRGKEKSREEKKGGRDSTEQCLRAAFVLQSSRPSFVPEGQLILLQQQYQTTRATQGETHKLKNHTS